MRRLLSESVRVVVTALMLLLLANGVASLLVLLHERGYLAEPQTEIPDAYFTSTNHAWPSEYFTELDAIKLRWHPYSYWLGRPFTGKYINVGQDGLRHTWQNGLTLQGQHSRTSRIFMFGGSAMWGSEAPDNDTIPSALTRILAKEGISARITNFGQIGYVSTQELILLFEQLRNGNVPNLVIFYDGFNDTASAFQNGVAGITENEVNRGREFNALNSEAPVERRALYLDALGTFARNLAVVRVASSVLDRICPSCMASIRPQSYGAVWIELPSRPEGGLPKDLPNAVINTYLANVRLIADTGQQIGFRSLFYWQPALYSRQRLSPFEMKELYDIVPGEDNFFLATYALARVVAQDSRGAGDERPIDLNDALPQTEPCFVDTVHISGACNEVIARKMASDVIEVLSERPSPK